MSVSGHWAWIQNAEKCYKCISIFIMLEHYFFFGLPYRFFCFLEPYPASFLAALIWYWYKRLWSSLKSVAWVCSVNTNIMRTKEVFYCISFVSGFSSHSKIFHSNLGPVHGLLGKCFWVHMPLIRMLSSSRAYKKNAIQSKARTTYKCIIKFTGLVL